MNKKIKTFFLLFLIVFTIIILASGFLLKRYITPERVNAFIIPEIEKALQRKVAIQNMDIGILKGIDIKQLSIKESDGVSDFITCEHFVLKFKLLPLLSKNVVINRMILKKPDIRIRRNSDETYNFSDIAEKQDPEKTEKAADQSKESLISLIVRNISIDEARFSFIDAKKELPDVKGSTSADLSLKTTGPGKITSNGKIDLHIHEALVRKPSAKTVQNIPAELDYGFLINTTSQDIIIDKAKLRIQDIPASVSGSINNIKTAPEIDLNISASNIDTSEVLKLLSVFAEVKDLEIKGIITADMKISGIVSKPESLSADGTVLLDNVSTRYKGMHFLTNGNLRITSSMVEIEPSEIAFQGIPASISGTISNFRTSPEVDLSLTIPKTDAGQAQRSMASLIETKGLGLSGILSADLKVAGRIKDMKSFRADGDIKLDNLGIRYRDLKAVMDGTVTAAGQSLSLALDTTFGKNVARLEGAVKNLFKNQQIAISISSKKIALDELFVPGAHQEESSDKQESLEGDASAVEAKPLTLNLSANGDIRIDNAVYKDLNMSDFILLFQVQNNILKITTMTAGIGKGAVDLTSSVNFSKPGYAYAMTGRVDAVRMEELVNSLAPSAKETLFGIITSNISLAGAGTTPKSIKNNLTGNGNFSLKDGKITNSKLPEKLAQFLGVPELRTINLKKASGNINVSNGLAHLTSVFASDDLSMDPSGKIGLDKTLDLAFDLKLSPPLTKKITFNSNIAQYIKDEGGWGTIPLTVSGTFSDPSYGVDIEKAGKRVIKEKGKKLLEKIFEKDKGEKALPESADEPVKEDKKPVEDLIKGLFK
ncbi:MAG: AsmA family protein [Nitrospiraceae bacterium]|nr:MAG: AsmA family protein [Nitrospiraceae bacterium]